MSFDADENDVIQEKQIETKVGPTYSNEPTIETFVHNNLPKDWKTPKGPSKNNIIRKINKEVSIRLKLYNLCDHVAFVSQLELEIVNDALNELMYLDYCNAK